MDITIDRRTLYPFLGLAGLLILLGLAALGRSYSRDMEAGDVRVLTWNDWQRTKAEHRFTAERAMLRADVDDLAVLLNEDSDPVAAQLLSERIGRHSSSGEAILQPARTAVLQAAQDVVNWCAGALERDTAIASLKTAASLLK